MSSIPAMGAIAFSRNPDVARALPDRRQEAPAFRRTPAETVRSPSVDRSDEAATFQERVEMLFDAKAPPGGPFSRSFEFNVSGVAGKITEAGAGQLYIDFPQRGIGMLLKDGVCTPTGNASPRDVAAMQRATLLGLST